MNIKATGQAANSALALVSSTSRFKHGVKHGYTSGRLKETSNLELGSAFHDIRHHDLLCDTHYLSQPGYGCSCCVNGIEYPVAYHLEHAQGPNVFDFRWPYCALCMVCLSVGSCLPHWSRAGSSLRTDRPLESTIYLVFRLNVDNWSNDRFRASHTAIEWSTLKVFRFIPINRTELGLKVKNRKQSTKTDKLSNHHTELDDLLITKMFVKQVKESIVDVMVI